MLDGFNFDGDLHPLDAVEVFASRKAWEFDRLSEDRIALTVEGLWRLYTLTLTWQPADETLRLLCTFEMNPPPARHPALFDLLNRANDSVWTGAFTYWPDQRLMVWRYGLALPGGLAVGAGQIEHLMQGAVAASERFYPAFQLVAWGDAAPDKALHIAIAEACGRA
ncbi:YbjN domain-containing protein [Falsirhodobacter sp. 20TX0035]|uniref:YbjN domain-containing protein n=1 Tax=Falsirhodobacter sp. 20TX0035 TaxID=3022019 RepID=UPI00232C338E|nr:YbjN domain-containing protein [Falsirhodobacter sp. 20TX0035]MDB6452297.1 YbjN domain-containing protein [Falsirhodobacter sp. 20TX0035]